MTHAQVSTFVGGGDVHANGIRQHYLRYGGRGRTVILIPGITSPAVTWGFVGERFGRGFDTYILDVRGRGLSQSGTALDYGLDAMAADVREFAASLRLDDYALVGHSMGARISLRAIARQGVRPYAAVLIDPPVSGPGRRPYPATLPWYVDSIRLSADGCDGEALRAFCPTWTDEQRALRAEWLHTCYPPAIVRTFEDFQKDDIHVDFPALSCPTLLIAAGRGDVIRPEEEQEIRALQPHLQVVRVEGAGHMIPWDDEEGFYRAFGTFLGRTV